jgi:hypothetical protein
MMVVPVTETVFNNLVKDDPSLADNPRDLEEMEKLFAGYSFFLVLTPDITENPERVRKIINTAYLRASGGQIIRRSRDAERDLIGRIGFAEEYRYIVFPRIPEGGYTLFFRNHNTGEETWLSW